MKDSFVGFWLTCFVNLFVCFEHFEYIFPLLLASIVSDEKLAVNFDFLESDESFASCYFQVSLLVFGSRQFYSSVSVRGSLCIYPNRYLLSFLNV